MYFAYLPRIFFFSIMVAPIFYFSILRMSRISFRRFLLCFCTLSAQYFSGIDRFLKICCRSSFHRLHHIFLTFYCNILCFFSTIIFFSSPFFHELQNTLNHQFMTYFPFHSKYLFYCCFCERYHELNSLLVHFLSFC